MKFITTLSLISLTSAQYMQNLGFNIDITKRGPDGKAQTFGYSGEGLKDLLPLIPIVANSLGVGLNVGGQLQQQ